MRTSLLLLAAALAACSSPGQPAEATVAVATDLAPWARAHQQQLSDALGSRVAIVAGPSGQLVTQLLAGAPFDLLLSADRATLDRLQGSERCEASSTRTFASGRLGIALAPHLNRPPTLETLASEAVKTIAIANPEHAPYGRLARAYLASTSESAALLPKLVIASSAADAAAWVDRGAVDAAVTAWSLLRARPEAQHVRSANAASLPATGIVCGPAAAIYAPRWKALIAASWFHASLAESGFGPPP